MNIVFDFAASLIGLVILSLALTWFYMLVFEKSLQSPNFLKIFKTIFFSIVVFISLNFLFTKAKELLSPLFADFKSIAITDGLGSWLLFYMTIILTILIVRKVKIQ